MSFVPFLMKCKCCGCPTALDVAFIGVDATACACKTVTGLNVNYQTFVDGVWRVNQSGENDTYCIYNQCQTGLGTVAIRHVFSDPGCTNQTSQNTYTLLDFNIRLRKSDGKIDFQLNTDNVCAGPILKIFRNLSFDYGLGEAMPNELDCAVVDNTIFADGGSAIITKA